MQSDPQPASSERDPLATFRYRTVFISDLHLGSGKTSTPYLYEFLKHLDFSALKELYLVGDIVGGWEHQTAKQQPLPEMEKRVLDILNYMASRGVAIHYIPGNHDEKLRPLIGRLRARRDFSTFPENVIFEHESSYETEGPDKVRIKVVHGDQHDPELFVKPWFRPITFFTSTAYDMLIKADYHFSNACYKFLGVHVSAAKQLKNALKSFIGYFFSHKTLMQGLENGSYDGVLMGHTHMAGIQSFVRKGRKSWLINDGDWQESSTFAYVDDPAELPKIMHYKQERERRGFGRLPDADDPHPGHFAAMRPITNHQVRMIHRLWPARNRAACLADFNRAAGKIDMYRNEAASLKQIMDTLGERQHIDEPARARLAAIMDETRREAYDSQKKGMAAIFSKYAANEQLRGDDFIYAKTVVREFSVRSERKIRKHQRILEETGKRLDYPPGESEVPCPL